MTEQWKEIPGFEGRYHVSDLGRVKALSFMQRWRHGLRRVRERILTQQAINSGYQIVHLHLDNVRSARTVHRLVAQAFHPGADPALDVNHIDGDKKNNAATNLEWLDRGANHDHAVRLGLNTRAMRVRGHPVNGGPPVEFDSQSQAALQLGGVRNASKVSACIQGKQKTAMGYRWEQI